MLFIRFRCLGIAGSKISPSDPLSRRVSIQKIMNISVSTERNKTFPTSAPEPPRVEKTHTEPPGSFSCSACRSRRPAHFAAQYGREEPGDTKEKGPDTRAPYCKECIVACDRCSEISGELGTPYGTCVDAAPECTLCGGGVCNEHADPCLCGPSAESPVCTLCRGTCQHCGQTTCERCITTCENCLSCRCDRCFCATPCTTCKRNDGGYCAECTGTVRHCATHGDVCDMCKDSHVCTEHLVNIDSNKEATEENSSDYADSVSD